MIIVDERAAAKLEKERIIEKTREITFGAEQKQLRAEKTVSDKHSSISNIERQEGHKMSSTEFIRKLRLIDPGFSIDPHPYKKDRQNNPMLKDKAVLNLTVGDKKICISPCEEHIMPEWSIFDTMKIRKTNGEYTRIPHWETKRGWRTLLLRIIYMKLSSVTEIEKYFGAGDRESWKILTGKGTGFLPI